MNESDPNSEIEMLRDKVMRLELKCKAPEIATNSILRNSLNTVLYRLAREQDINRRLREKLVPMAAKRNALDREVKKLRKEVRQLRRFAS